MWLAAVRTSGEKHLMIIRRSQVSREKCPAQAGLMEWEGRFPEYHAIGYKLLLCGGVPECPPLVVLWVPNEDTLRCMGVRASRWS